MLKKPLAIMLAIMLLWPAAVLANVKPVFAASNSESPAFSGQGSHESGDIEKNKSDTESANVASDNIGSSDGTVEQNTVEQKEQKEQKEKKEIKEKREAKEQKEIKNQYSDGNKNNGGNIKQAAKTKGSDETTATVKIKQGHDKLTVKIKGTTPDSNTARGKARGIEVAMKAVISNVSKVGGNAINALKEVVNNFTSWLGLGPIFTGINRQSGSNSGSSQVL